MHTANSISHKRNRAKLLQHLYWNKKMLFILKFQSLQYLRGGCVGGCGGPAWGLLIPKVVRAVELRENIITKTMKNVVKLPHCVKRFNGFFILLNFFFNILLLQLFKFVLLLSLDTFKLTYSSINLNNESCIRLVSQNHLIKNNSIKSFFFTFFFSSFFLWDGK